MTVWTRHPQEQALVEAVTYLLKQRAIKQAIKYFTEKHDYDKRVAPQNLGRTKLHKEYANPMTCQKVIEYLSWLEPSSLSRTDLRGNLPLHLACAFLRKGSLLQAVEFLVEQYPEGLMETNKHGDSALHVACDHEAPLSVIAHLV